MSHPHHNAESATKPNLKVPVKFSSKLEKILFSFAVFYFVSELIFAIRLQMGNEFTQLAGWNLTDAVTRPFLLLVGAICLLVNRSWSLILAVVLGVSVIYSNVYLGLLGVAHAHGIWPLSFSALSIWLETIGGRQIINTAASLIIVSYSASKLIASARQNRPYKVVGTPVPNRFLSLVRRSK